MTNIQQPLTSQLKTEQVKTEVKIRVTPELPTFLALQDRHFESIFLLCSPRETLYVRIEAILATAWFATRGTRELKVLSVLYKNCIASVILGRKEGTVGLHTFKRRLRSVTQARVTFRTWKLHPCKRLFETELPTKYSLL